MKSVLSPPIYSQDKQYFGFINPSPGILQWTTSTYLDTVKSTGKVLCHLQNYKLIISMISSRLSDNDTMLQF